MNNNDKALYLIKQLNDLCDILHIFAKKNNLYNYKNINSNRFIEKSSFYIDDILFEYVNRNSKNPVYVVSEKNKLVLISSFMDYLSSDITINGKTHILGQGFTIDDINYLEELCTRIGNIYKNIHEENQHIRTI